jgi:hypothetical protein
LKQPLLQFGGGGSGMQRQLISLVHELLPAVCMYKSSWSK